MSPAGTASALAVGVVAPFAREAQFGGAQRARAMAEALEDRGHRIEWLRIQQRQPSAPGRIKRYARLQPNALRDDRDSRRDVTALARRCDALIMVHSYLAPLSRDVPSKQPVLIDFQNLEWAAMSDVASMMSPPRRVVLMFESWLLRRFEQALLRSSYRTSVLVQTDEFGWARTVAPASKTLLVPNVLPRDAVLAAADVARARSSRKTSGVMVYVGKLTHRPNATALTRFLEEHWTLIHHKLGVRLVIVGECSEQNRSKFQRLTGVDVRGFVDDPTALLAEADAALMPFGARGGSSLRVLQYALSRLPIIGEPLAFRGFPTGLGIAVRNTEDWVDAIALSRSSEIGSVIERAYETATELQTAESPWDSLVAALMNGQAVSR